MPIPLFQVDAFAERPFTGNPAAVCLLEAERDDLWMRNVAAEMNLSETAFVRPLDDRDAFELRWFTPKVEVDLCGHATLATAHVLWEEGILAADAPARFATKSGELTAARSGDWIELNFPALPEERSEVFPGLAKALGASPKHIGRNRLDYLVELESESIVRALEPDFRALSALPTRGIIATAVAETEGVDFVSRFFAPRAGIDEDPATGSAHCYLGPFWADRLSKYELVGLQVSARGGLVRVRVAGRRVLIAGKAATVFKGRLEV